jgi:hypothetical protein
MVDLIINAWKDFRRCLLFAPLPIIALIVYMGLRSTDFSPEGLHLFNGVFYYDYFGWYDIVLAYSILLTATFGRLKFDYRDWFFLSTLLSIIAVSWLGVKQADPEWFQAGSIYYLRFTLMFILGNSLVYKLGIETSEIVLVAVFSILALSSFFVLNQLFGSNNRLFAAAMTSASFGQVCTIIVSIAYVRKNHWLLFIAFVFTFLTFSRFCLLFLAVLIIIYQRKLISWKNLKNALIFVGIAIPIIFLLSKFGGEGYQTIFSSRASSSELATLNGRNTIWASAWGLFQTGQIPFFGVGFHLTPSLLNKLNLSFFDESEGVIHHIPHFHSISIEYGFGLGVPSLIILFLLIRRIIQTFSARLYPAFFIFAFFLMSQSVDYTFWMPKEVIVWSLMLGMAEGQYRYNRSKSSSSSL